MPGQQPRDDENELGSRVAKDIDHENTRGGRWAEPVVAGRALEAGGNEK